MKEKIAFYAIGVLMCATLVTVSGCSSASTPTPGTNSSTPTTTNTRLLPRLVKTGYQLDYTAAGGTTYLTPTGEKTAFPAAFQTLVKKNGGYLTSFVMPVDNTDEDTIYLSVSEITGNSRPYKVRTTILSYNIANGASKELYKESNENIELRTIGMEGTKLVVLPDYVDNSPGVCTEVWYDYRHQIKYLDLTNANEGLKPYDVPSYAVDADREKQEICLKELDDSLNNN